MPGLAGQRLERGLHRAVARAHVRAARMKRAARGQVDEARRLPRDRHELLAAVALEGRDRAEQTPRVRMLGRREEARRRPALDDPARVHHRDVVAHLGDDPQVVRDDDDGHPELVLQPHDELEDLRLHRDVERGRRLVGDQEARLVGERHRDHRALAHAAGELVREGVDAALGLGDPDRAEQLDRALARLRLGHVAMRPDRLHELDADAVERMQRRQRVLEDHRDVVAAQPAQLALGQPQQLAPAEGRAAGDARARRAREAHERQTRHALARPRLADDPQHAAGLQREGDAVDGLHDPVLGIEVHAQVGDLQQRRGRAHQ